MSESGDYEPSSYSRGHDFTQARQTYKSHAARSYGEAKSSGKTHGDLVPSSITAKCKRPLIIIVDETGSMDDWPATLFSKFPYLEYEGKEYLGQDLEFCFMAVGDARNNETYPLQARPFVKGKDIADKLKELVIEGNGGGNGKESYELPALYCLFNVKIPEDAQPIIIFIGDEGLYNEVTVSDAREYAKVKLSESMSVKDLFENLKKKFSVYIVRKSYGGGACSDDSINRQWQKLLDGDQAKTGDTKQVKQDEIVHVKNLDDPNRVVDVIFGILAEETKRIPYFQEEFEARQKDHPEYYKTVYKALKSRHIQGPTAKKPGRSRMHAGDEEKGEDAEPLM